MAPQLIIIVHKSQVRARSQLIRFIPIKLSVIHLTFRISIPFQDITKLFNRTSSAEIMATRTTAAIWATRAMAGFQIAVGLYQAIDPVEGNLKCLQDRKSSY